MKTVKLYEAGEEVFVKAKITGVSIENGEIKYRLENNLTGKDYGYLFTDDQIFQIPKLNTKGGNESEGRKDSKRMGNREEGSC